MKYSDVMNADISSTLAPPGAGLPAMERLVGGLIFALRRWTGTREGTNARFQKERAAIHSMVEGVAESELGNPGADPSPAGFGGHSRYWSILMTLDHLRIVHGQMSRVILALGSGQTPAGVASTAAVKPSAEVTPAVVPAYERSCDELLAAVAAVPDLKTRVRFSHPWFGPLDAAGWHTLAAGHMGIHRTQMERIRAGLTAKG